MVDVVEAALKGEALVPAGHAAVTVAQSLPHGHVAAVHAMAAKLGLPALLGPACRRRDLALALILSRVAHPGSKLSTIAWWSDVTLGPDLGIAGRDHRRGVRGDGLAAVTAGRDRDQARPPAPRPGREPVEDGAIRPVELVAGRGRTARWARAATPATARRATRRSSTGCSPTPKACVAVRVLEGNTADPAAFTEIAGVVKDTFGLKRMVMVGDRGMITSARIEALRELDGSYGWITALRAPAIRKLMADDGPLQLSLFDEQDLAEITSPDFPGERLIACRNPALAGERARKREDLLAATEKLLTPLIARVAAGQARPRRRDRRQGRRGDRQVQDGQALRRRHHRHQPHRRAQANIRSTTRPGSTGSTSSAPPSPKPTSAPPEP